MVPEGGEVEEPSRPGVLSPDVEHEDGGNEEKAHHQNRNWANFDSGRVVRVELPHAAACGIGGARPSTAGSRGFPLFHGGASA